MKDLKDRIKSIFSLKLGGMELMDVDPLAIDPSIIANVQNSLGILNSEGKYKIAEAVIKNDYFICALIRPIQTIGINGDPNIKREDIYIVIDCKNRKIPLDYKEFSNHGESIFYNLIDVKGFEC